MRTHNVMPTNAQIRECFAIWTDGGNHPKSLEQLVEILDETTDRLDRFWNKDEDIVI